MSTGIYENPSSEDDGNGNGESDDYDSEEEEMLNRKTVRESDRIHLKDYSMKEQILMNLNKEIGREVRRRTRATRNLNLNSQNSSFLDKMNASFGNDDDNDSLAEFDEDLNGTGGAFSSLMNTTGGDISDYYSAKNMTQNKFNNTGMSNQTVKSGDPRSRATTITNAAGLSKLGLNKTIDTSKIEITFEKGGLIIDVDATQVANRKGQRIMLMSDGTGVNDDGGAQNSQNLPAFGSTNLSNTHSRNNSGGSAMNSTMGGGSRKLERRPSRASMTISDKENIEDLTGMESQNLTPTNAMKKDAGTPHSQRHKSNPTTSPNAKVYYGMMRKPSGVISYGTKGTIAGGMIHGASMLYSKDPSNKLGRDGVGRFYQEQKAVGGLSLTHGPDKNSLGEKPSGEERRKEAMVAKEKKKQITIADIKMLKRSQSRLGASNGKGRDSCDTGAGGALPGTPSAAQKRGTFTGQGSKKSFGGRSQSGLNVNDVSLSELKENKYIKPSSVYQNRKSVLAQSCENLGEIIDEVAMPVGPTTPSNTPPLGENNTPTIGGGNTPTLPGRSPKGSNIPSSAEGSRNPSRTASRSLNRSSTVNNMLGQVGQVLNSSQSTMPREKVEGRTVSNENYSRSPSPAKDATSGQKRASLKHARSFSSAGEMRRSVQIDESKAESANFDIDNKLSNSLGKGTNFLNTSSTNSPNHRRHMSEGGPPSLGDSITNFSHPPLDTPKKGILRKEENNVNSRELVPESGNHSSSSSQGGSQRGGALETNHAQQSHNLNSKVLNEKLRLSASTTIPGARRPHGSTIASPQPKLINLNTKISPTVSPAPSPKNANFGGRLSHNASVEDPSVDLGTEFSFNPNPVKKPQTLHLPGGLPGGIGGNLGRNTTGGGALQATKKINSEDELHLNTMINSSSPLTPLGGHSRQISGMSGLNSGQVTPITGQHHHGHHHRVVPSGTDLRASRQFAPTQQKRPQTAPGHQPPPLMGRASMITHFVGNALADKEKSRPSTGGRATTVRKTRALDAFDLALKQSSNEKEKNNSRSPRPRNSSRGPGGGSPSPSPGPSRLTIAPKQGMHAGGDYMSMDQMNASVISANTNITADIPNKDLLQDINLELKNVIPKSYCEMLKLDKYGFDFHDWYGLENLPEHQKRKFEFDPAKKKKRPKTAAERLMGEKPAPERHLSKPLEQSSWQDPIRTAQPIKCGCTTEADAHGHKTYHEACPPWKPADRRRRTVMPVVPQKTKVAGSRYKDGSVEAQVEIKNEVKMYHNNPYDVAPKIEPVPPPGWIGIGRIGSGHGGGGTGSVVRIRAGGMGRRN